LDVLAAEDALIATRRVRAALETRALTLDIDLIRALGGGYQNS
jgi:outer membrane protein TolC